MASSGRPFEDADFPPSATSLGAGWAHASLATQWRRPSEIAGDGATLFKNDWEIEGIVPGPAQNDWLMAALNILAGDREVLHLLWPYLPWPYSIDDADREEPLPMLGRAA